jgi:hypothetical protein
MVLRRIESERVRKNSKNSPDNTEKNMFLVSQSFQVAKIGHIVITSIDSQFNTVS